MENSVQQEKQKRLKLKSSALQLTLVISMIISILLGCLIYLFYFYKQQESRFVHKDRMLQLMDAAVALGQSAHMGRGDTLIQGLLFPEDSIHLHKARWGLYEVITIRARYHRDSAARAFLLGLERTDSTVIYVADEDRNLSVSGKTHIKGHAFVPKSGIRPAFVDGKFYQGKEEIISGKKSNSSREIPSVQDERLKQLWAQTANPSKTATPTTYNSFMNESYLLSDSLPLTVTESGYSGRIILHSDSLVSIDANANVQDIICIAPVIKIGKGFQGRLQAFAKDSIILADQVHLDYPSALVVWAEDEKTRREIKTGKDCRIEGTVWLYEPKRSRLPHLINLGENNKIMGDLLAQGMIKYKKPLQVWGSSYCYRFITQTQSALYENFLIDMEMDRTKLSPFFLHGEVWEDKKNTTNYKILQWLN